MPLRPTWNRSASVRLPTGDANSVCVLASTKRKIMYQTDSTLWHCNGSRESSIPICFIVPFQHCFIWGRPLWLVRPQGSVLDHWTIEASLFTAAAETSSLLTLKCRILLAVTLHLEDRNWFAFSFFCSDLESKGGALHELYQLFGVPGSQGPLLWLVFFGEKVRQKETHSWEGGLLVGVYEMIKELF